MNSLIVYRNPLEQWFWEGGAIYVFFAFVILWIALNAKRWAVSYFCKHEKVWEDRACNAHCTKCHKNLGFIGKWRDRKLCEFDVTTIKEAAEKGKENLHGADLHGANLGGYRCCG